MNELKLKLLNDIISDLADNYFDDDQNVIKELLDETIANAFFISNREQTKDNLKVLFVEIKNCVKSLYLLRGTEDVKSLSASGKNASYRSPVDEMREAIIKNGKRKLF